jgi:thymidine phosphorylase
MMQKTRRYDLVQEGEAAVLLPLDRSETVALTRAMVEVGERLSWPRMPIVDKHSVGGLPGNRTTPIIVAIIAANGLTMPKTSSRAFTSPAGTAIRWRPWRRSISTCRQYDAS